MLPVVRQDLVVSGSIVTPQRPLPERGQSARARWGESRAETVHTPGDRHFHSHIAARLDLRVAGGVSFRRRVRRASARLSPLK